MVFIVSITVPVAYGGNSVGERGNIIIYIAGRPKQKEVDVKADTEGIKAQKQGGVRAGINNPVILVDCNQHKQEIYIQVNSVLYK